MTDIKPPKVFISYAWEEELKTWVLELATRLRLDGVEAILDQWAVVPGDQLTQFMEKAVRESDFVVFICTPTYKRKSDRRKGGVGYEGGIITGEVFAKNNHRKFIPVLRKGKWASAAPSWATSKLFIDLRGDPYSEANYQQLLNTLLGKSPSAPPVRDDTLRERLEREAAEKVAREKEGRDVVEKFAQEKSEREIAEKAALEKAERETAERVVREDAERETAEKLVLEKIEREAAEKATREKAERDAAESAIKEKEKREADEKMVQKKKQRELERKVKKIFDDSEREIVAINREYKWKKFLSSVRYRLVLVRVYSLPIMFALIAIASLIFLVFYLQKNFPGLTQVLNSTPQPSQIATGGVISIEVFPPNSTPIESITPIATSLPTEIFVPTEILTPTPTFEPRSINWGGTQVSWSGQPISLDNVNQLMKLAKIQIGRSGIYANNNTESVIVSSRDGKMLIYGFGTVIYVRQIEDFKLIRTLKHPHDIDCIDLSPDGSLLASISGNGELRVWKMTDGSFLQDLSDKRSDIGCPIFFSPDGSLLAILDDNGISIRQASDLSLLKKLDVPDRFSSYYAFTTFSPDGNFLAVRSDNIYVWNVRDGKLVHTINTSGYGSGIMFSPDGSLLAFIDNKYDTTTQHSDGMISIWRVEDWSLLQTLSDVSSPELVPSGPFFFLPNGRIIISGMYKHNSGINEFRLWRVSDGVPIQDVNLGELINAGTVSSDGSILFFLSRSYLFSAFIHSFGVMP